MVNFFWRNFIDIILRYDEWIWVLSSVIWTIWKNDIFSTGPPSLEANKHHAPPIHFTEKYGVKQPTPKIRVNPPSLWTPTCGHFPWNFLPHWQHPVCDVPPDSTSASTAPTHSPYCCVLQTKNLTTQLLDHLRPLMHPCVRLIHRPQLWLWHDLHLQHVISLYLVQVYLGWLASIVPTSMSTNSISCLLHLVNHSPHCPLLRGCIYWGSQSDNHQKCPSCSTPHLSLKAKD